MAFVSKIFKDPRSAISDTADYIGRNSEDIVGGTNTLALKTLKKGVDVGGEQIGNALGMNPPKVPRVQAPTTPTPAPLEPRIPIPFGGALATSPLGLSDPGEEIGRRKRLLGG